MRKAFAIFLVVLGIIICCVFHVKATDDTYESLTIDSTGTVVNTNAVTTFTNSLRRSTAPSVASDLTRLTDLQGATNGLVTASITNGILAASKSYTDSATGAVTTAYLSSIAGASSGLTNLIASTASGLTNYTLAQVAAASSAGTNYAAGLIQGMTNYVNATVGGAASGLTNYTLAQVAAAANSGTNFAAGVGQSATNYTLAQVAAAASAGTNYANSVTNGLVTASITNGLVTASITNGILSSANSFASGATNAIASGTQTIQATNLTGNLRIVNFNGGIGANNTTFLRGDNTWATPAGSGGGNADTNATSQSWNPNGTNVFGWINLGGVVSNAWPSAGDPNALTNITALAPVYQTQLGRVSTISWSNDAGYETKTVTNGILSTAKGYTDSSVGNASSGLTNLIGSTASGLTNYTLSQVAAAANAGTNYSAGLSQGLTNLIASSANAGTNYANGLAQGLTNLVAGSANAGTNYANGLAQGLTNLVATAASAGTNFSAGVGQSATNYTDSTVANAANAGTNYANGLAQGLTNLIASSANASTNYANGLIQGMTNYIDSATNGCLLKTGGTMSGALYVTGGITAIGVAANVSIGQYAYWPNTGPHSGIVIGATTTNLDDNMLGAMRGDDGTTYVGMRLSCLDISPTASGTSVARIDRSGVATFNNTTINGDLLVTNSITTVHLIAQDVTNTLLFVTNLILGADMNANGKGITNMLAGVNALDAVNMTQLQGATNGLSTAAGLTNRVNNWTAPQYFVGASNNVGSVTQPSTLNIFSDGTVGEGAHIALFTTNDGTATGWIGADDLGMYIVAKGNAYNSPGISISRTGTLGLYPATFGQLKGSTFWSVETAMGGQGGLRFNGRDAWEIGTVDTANLIVTNTSLMTGPVTISNVVTSTGLVTTKASINMSGTGITNMLAGVNLLDAVNVAQLNGTSAVWAAAVASAGTNYTDGLIQGMTNLVASSANASTNYANGLAQGLTNLVASAASAGTNYANSVTQSLVNLVFTPTNNVLTGTSNTFDRSYVKIVGPTNATKCPLVIYGQETNHASPYVLNKNCIGLDGVINGDRFVNWMQTGVVRWAAGTYRDEDMEFWYLHHNPGQRQSLTISEAGRFGINKLADIMNYHSVFAGTGLDDMSVSGVFTLRRTQFFKVAIDGVGAPNTFLWATSFDNTSFTTNATTVNCSATPISLTNGVSVAFAATTGHTSGDSWSFKGNPQMPIGTFTINPSAFTEIGTSTNFADASGWSDISYKAQDLDVGSVQVLPTGNKAAIYFGDLIKRNSVNISITTPAIGCTLVVEYWNGAAWTEITAAMGLVDLTESLTKSGTITWTKSLMADWSKEGLTLSDYANQYYWIRLRSSSSITAAPVAALTSPNGSYRLAVFGSAYGTIPAFYVDPIGDVYIAKKAFANTTPVSGKEVVNLDTLRAAILASQQSIMYARSTTNTVNNQRLTLLPTPAAGSTITTLTTNNVGLTQVRIAAFMGSNQVGVVVFPAGTYHVVSYGSVNSVGAGTVSRITARLFLSPTGTETNFFTPFGESAPLTTTANSLREFDITLPTNAVCNATDYLGCTFYATNSSATTRNISLAIEGATATRVNLPLAIGSLAIGYIAKDGSVPWTGANNMGGQVTTNAAAGTTLSSYIIASQLNATSSWAITQASLNATNIASVVANSATNYTLAQVAAAANAGTNYSDGLAQGLTNLIASSASAGTNYSAGLAQGLTNLIASSANASTNFAAGVGSSSTNYANSLIQGMTNLLASTASGLTNLVNSATNGAVAVCVNTNSPTALLSITSMVDSATVTWSIADRKGTATAIASGGTGVATNNFDWLALSMPNFGSLLTLTTNLGVDMAVTPTVSAGACALVSSLRVKNDNASGVTFSIHLSDGSTEIILADAYTVGARSAVTYENIALNAGGWIQVPVGTNGISVTANYAIQETNTWTGFSKVWGNVTNDLLLVNPVAASTKVRVKNLYVFNTNVAGTVFSIMHIDAAAKTNYVEQDYTIGAKSLYQLKNLYLNAGDSLRGYGTNCVSITTEEVR